mgnify:CR=1 FL=1
MRRVEFRVAAAAAAGLILLLSGCSVTITANEAPAESAAVEGSAAATPDASQAAAIDEEYYNFCKLEAENNIELVAEMGDMANEMIADGISESIAGQALEGAQADSCRQAWIETMAANQKRFDLDDSALSQARAALVQVQKRLDGVVLTFRLGLRGISGCRQGFAFDGLFGRVARQEEEADGQEAERQERHARNER